MGLSVELIDAGWRPPDSDWDAFVAQEDLPAFWDGAALHAYARCSPESVDLACVRVDGALAAVACLRGARLGLPVRRYRDLESRRRPALLRCSVPVSFDTGLAFAGGLRAEDHGPVLAELERAVRVGFAPWCYGIVFESVPPARAPLFDGARLVLRQAPGAVLPVRWPDLDAYLAQLPRARRRRFAALYARVQEDPAIEAFAMRSRIDAQDATRLEFATRLRHVARTAPLPAGYLDAVLAAGRAGVFGYRRAGGSLLQFDLALRTGAALVTTVTGGDDRSVAGELYHALYLSEIAYAAVQGIPALRFGSGTLAEKLRFGCELAERRAYVRALTPRRGRARRAAGSVRLASAPHHPARRPPGADARLPAG